MSEPNGNGHELPAPIEAPLPVLRAPDLDAAATEAFKKLGFGNISAATVRAGATIGLFAEGVGMLRTQRGNAVVTQQWLHEQLRKIGVASEKLIESDDPKVKFKDKCQTLATLSRAMAEIAREMTSATKAALENERTATGHGIEEPIRDPNFRPGEIIRPAQQNIIQTDSVHFHPAIPREPEAK